MFVEAFAGIAAFVWGVRDRLRAIKQDRRDRVAQYFEDISRCLAEISAAVEQGQNPPVETCAELTRFVRTLPELMDGVVEPEEAASFAAQVRDASNARGLVSELSSSADAASRERQRAVIAEASGLFRAVASELRVPR